MANACDGNKERQFGDSINPSREDEGEGEGEGCRSKNLYWYNHNAIVIPAYIIIL